MSAEIFQFSAARRIIPANIKTNTPLDDGGNLQAGAEFSRGGRPLPPPATETAKNARIRDKHGLQWKEAERAAQYWLARADWVDALKFAQSYDVGDSASLGDPPGDRIMLIGLWRQALVEQLLTRAPNVAAVAWKRVKLEGRGFGHLPVTREQVERAIAADVAFLKAHPTRRSNSEAMAKTREFKEAMRRRIRKLAAERSLPDEEIKRVLRLKHHEIGTFAIKHSVSLAWLLEGAGPVFKKYPEREQ